MNLERLIAVLEAVAAAGRPVSASEVQGVTGLPRPTCYRLIQTLATHRFLDSVEGDGRWLLGDRFKRIAMMGRSDADIRLATAPLIKEAAIADGDAYFLSRFRNNSVEIIHVETPDDPKASFIHPGLGRRPMHACSCSKAIAAFSDAALQHRIIDGALKAYTDRTKIDAADLAAEFAAIRARGFAECVEEIEIGVASVAAPVHMADASVPFSIGAIGTIRRFTDTRRSRLGEKLIGLADQVRNTIVTGYLERERIN